eukprot:CAMPEP_0196660194 /NCGR_PEP_ID=MMETSP1086-20130531/38621_1 /TAXON_ID=77921 /ORGANISM="Cyanoptyche  gloeocystis , Strain SAG4.97" /LENGTH=124 /DNA_ID=CAMNT_0041994493 /DNA_START=443 /DNA_END=814 /DNA_ORIENTATION=-
MDDEGVGFGRGGGRVESQGDEGRLAAAEVRHGDAEASAVRRFHRDICGVDGGDGGVDGCMRSACLGAVVHFHGVALAEGRRVHEQLVALHIRLNLPIHSRRLARPLPRRPRAAAVASRLAPTLW